MDTNKPSYYRPEFNNGQILRDADLANMVGYAEQYAEECAGAVESALDERMDTVETQLGIGDNTNGGTLASRVSNAETKIGNLNEQVFGNADGTTTTDDALISRVSDLEETVALKADVNPKIENLNKQVFGKDADGTTAEGTLIDRVDDLEDTLSDDVNPKIENLNTQVFGSANGSTAAKGALTNRVGTLETKTASLENSFSNLIVSISKYNTLPLEDKKKVIFIVGSENDNTDITLEPNQIYFKCVEKQNQ